MNQKKDLETIKDVLNGNTNAFSELVECYKDLVYTLALRLMKDRIKAEEMAQNTFIKVFKKLSTFKGQSKFSSWIYRITYNTCLDELRTKKKNFNTITINEFSEYEIATIDNALSRMENEELKRTIQVCIDKLPNEAGFLLTLFYFQDYSIQEMAKVLGLKPNNTKVKLHRARLKLAEILKKQLEPEIILSYERK